MNEDNESELPGLDVVHNDINACTICKDRVVVLKKPATMRRGDPGKIVIVGMAPGNTEVEKGVAFSGLSGKRLNQWLKDSGADPTEPRKGIYFTSVVKCQTDSKTFDVMAQNCSRFLVRQLEILRPNLMISLGQQAYEALRIQDIPFASAICQPQRSESVLLTPFNFAYVLLPWPHPSGLNRWLNDAQNLTKLKSSFSFVQQYLSPK